MRLRLQWLFTKYPVAFSIGLTLLFVGMNVGLGYFFDYLYFYTDFYPRLSWLIWRERLYADNTRSNLILWLVPLMPRVLFITLLVTLLGLWRKIGFTKIPRWQELQWYMAPFIFTCLKLTPFLALENAPKNWPSFFADNLLYSLFSPLFVYQIVIGFIEEVLYRGVVQTAVTRYPNKFAITFTALLFGIMHLANLRFQSIEVTLRQVLHTFASGWGYSALQAKTGTIWPQIILHALGNLFVDMFDEFLMNNASNIDFLWIAQVSAETQLFIYHAPSYLKGAYGLWVASTMRKPKQPA